MRVLCSILGLRYICNPDKKKQFNCCFVLNGRCTFILYAINLFNSATFVCLMLYVVVYIFILKWLFVLLYIRSPKGVYCFITVRPSFRPSFRPSKIFFVAFFSVTIDGRNLIFGHTLHIGTPYGGKRFEPVIFLLPACRLCWFLYTLDIYANFSSHFSQQLLMAETWYLVTRFK